MIWAHRWASDKRKFLRYLVWSYKPVDVPEQLAVKRFFPSSREKSKVILCSVHVY